MVIFFVAFMFLTLIGISYVVERKRKTGLVTAVATTAQPQPELYIHPSHSFARVDGDFVEIGMDEFSKRAFGDVQILDAPQVGTVLHQGDLAWKLQVGDRVVSQRMPVSARVTEVSPEKAGYILKAKATNLKDDLVNLIKGGSMMTWLKKARAQFVADYSGEVMPALQDGGELAEGFARHLNDEQWKEFCREFFNCE